MKIHIHANCQGWGLEWFFKRSPDADKFTTALIQNFRICTKEETREQEKEVVETADILFYHATKRVFPWPETVQPKPDCQLIPISVFYNGAYFFMENARKEIWQPALDMAQSQGPSCAAQWLVNESDLDYRARWQADLDHMRNKEEEEGVAPELRISDWQHQGHEWAQLLTKNHPSSLLFLRWANLLLEYIGMRPMEDEWEAKAREQQNLVYLPCEDWVTNAAKKHLGLKWGATEYEHRRALEFGHNKLKAWLEGKEWP